MFKETLIRTVVVHPTVFLTVAVLVTFSYGPSLAQPCPPVQPLQLCPPYEVLTGGDGLLHIVIEDLNADQFPDIIGVNTLSNDVSVLLGSAGGFTTLPGSPFSTDCDTPVAVAVDDLNGDGVPDLVVACQNSNDLSVLFADGMGSFVLPPMLLPSCGGPNCVAIEDLNDDGSPDLAVADVFSDEVSIFLGDGAGGFDLLQPCVPAGDGPRWLAIEDLDADGDFDIVVVNVRSNDVWVLLNDGSAAFVPHPMSPFWVGTAPRFVVIEDLDGDGMPDVAVANGGSNDVSVLLGDTGNFVASQGSPFAAGTLPYSIAVGDLNGGGLPDLATANGNSNDLSVLLNCGQGEFAPQVIFQTGDIPNAVAIADIDLDGALDVVVANNVSESVFVFLNGINFNDLMRGDCDGNGVVNALVDGIFLLNFGFSQGDPPPCEEAADVNGDGVVNALVDALYLFNFGFIPGSPPPPAPFPGCGPDADCDANFCDTPTC